MTYPDSSVVSTTKATNCGDVLTIWATGLGPVNGSVAAGAALGVNMTAIPLTIWLGRVHVTAAYQRRSGCFIGEDQIIFTVPANVPLACAVPLTVQIKSPSVALTTWSVPPGVKPPTAMGTTTVVDPVAASRNPLPIFSLYVFRFIMMASTRWPASVAGDRPIHVARAILREVRRRP